MKKIIVGISGASGVGLGAKFLHLLPDNIEAFVVVSNGAKTALKYEQNIQIKVKNNITVFDDTNMAAPISSGSFQTDGMIIIPCSMNTLAKCSVGISDTLITRAFSVMLKEKRKIVISPREMPFNTIQLENMTKLSSMGVVVSPPVLGYYSQQQTLADMENFIIGKMFDSLGIEHNLYQRWSGNEKSDI